MRAFITGASGFVGTWLGASLAVAGDTVDVLDEAIDLGAANPSLGPLIESAPDVVYHLAALTSVGRSWESPAEVYQVNVLGTLAVLEAARQCVSMPRVVLVSTSEVYGRGSADALTEDSALQPISPYAASKVAAEYLGVQAFLGRGLEVIRARPFNHVGPGQSDQFVVSALAKRVVKAQASSTGEIVVGNLEARRDFTDVRDVVRAYRLLAEHGTPGEVYNICSGEAQQIGEILEQLIELSGSPVRTRVDPELFRPVDAPYLLGDAARLSKATGWAPERPFAETLADVLADWRQKLAAPPG